MRLIVESDNASMTDDCVDSLGLDNIRDNSDVYIPRIPQSIRLDVYCSRLR